MNHIKKFLFILIVFVFSFSVVLADDIAVTGITLNEHSATLIIGATDQLTATLAPIDATNTTILWSSSNESMATVDNNGLVTTIATGNATITATSADGSFTDNDILTINGQEVHINIQTSVDVPESCNATDTDGVSHNYPKGDSYLAICALEAAIDNGSISSALSNEYPEMGLFITTMNDVVADPNSQYWAILQNENLAQLGISSLPVVVGDVIMLQLQDFSGNNIGDEVTLNINSLITPEPEPVHHSSSGSRIKIEIEKPIFDSKKALDFISTQQKENGSFGEDIYTDWATLALASSPDYQDQKVKLTKYLSENKFSGTLLTDYERHAMALMALNLNPYSTNSENYIEKITNSFDEKQFGDIEKDNDDIFALIVLQNAGFNQDEKIISDTIDFIISKQKENGSWDENVDMTGAGIEALTKFKEMESVKASLEEAKEYLKQNQKENGSWENVSSTTWAMEGILALGEKPEDWIINGNTPINYLGENQDEDGGIKITEEQGIENKIWQTSYAITATSGKTWNDIMQKFEKPKIEIIPVQVSSLLPVNNTPNIVNTNETNSHQATFAKKIKKFQKPVEKKEKPVELITNPIVEQIPTPIQKKSFFQRLFELIFGF